jgi:hypothetical protein
MRHRALAVVAVLALGAAAAPASDRLPPAEWLLDQVKVLAAPAMDGRASGTAGAERAAQRIAGVFRDAGLRAASGASFFQVFDVPTGIRLGADNALDVVAPQARALALGADFVPLGVSADGDVTGDVVFAGYGITAPDLGYDDYASLDVRGRVVLVMTGEPRTRDPASPFRRPDAYHYGERSHKIINARQRGALAVLLVRAPAAAPAPLRLPSGTTPSWEIVAAEVSSSVATSLCVAAGARLADLAASIDQALAPRSQLLAGVRVRVHVGLVRERGKAANVIGVLPGADPQLAGEAIVVGAHYDHLGRGSESSLAPADVGQVHHGADDNASGTAAVMALAKAFAAAGGTPRTLVFVAFAGEEMGLLGSTHYVRHPAIAMNRTVLMLNLDMVGRLRDGRLYVGGVDSGSGLRQIVSDAAQGLPLTLTLRGDPFGSSDHTAFYSVGRPVLFLFTGAHEDYHRPGDTWDRINAAGLATVTVFASRVVSTLARTPTPPAYARVEGAAAARPRGGYGPFFGVVPEFGEPRIPGVKVGGVRPGSPAEKAGVQAGDVILKFGGVTVKTLEEFTFVLRSRRPGDRVEVVLSRDGREQTVEARLEERR